MDQLIADLALVLEKHDRHKACQIPGWMLARFLKSCLDGFIRECNERDRWKLARLRDPQWPPPQDLKDPNWPPPPAPPEPQG